MGNGLKKSKFKYLNIFKNNMVESQINGIHLFSIFLKYRFDRFSLACLKTDHPEKF